MTAAMDHANKWHFGIDFSLVAENRFSMNMVKLSFEVEPHRWFIFPGWTCNVADASGPPLNFSSVFSFFHGFVKGTTDTMRLLIISVWCEEFSTVCYFSCETCASGGLASIVHVKWGDLRREAFCCLCMFNVDSVVTLEALFRHSREVSGPPVFSGTFERGSSFSFGAPQRHGASPRCHGGHGAEVSHSSQSRLCFQCVFMSCHALGISATGWGNSFLRHPPAFAAMFYTGSTKVGSHKTMADVHVGLMKLRSVLLWVCGTSLANFWCWRRRPPWPVRYEGVIAIGMANFFFPVGRCVRRACACVRVRLAVFDVCVLETYRHKKHDQKRRYAEQETVKVWYLYIYIYIHILF